MTVRLAPTTYGDTAFAPMLAEAGAAGLRFVQRLRDEWRSGVERFDGPGSLLLGAWDGERIVAVGGITVDPYRPEPGFGRLRHLYVVEDRRREGLGRALVTALLAHGRAHFDVVRLRTDNPVADLFYRTLGFETSDLEDETHRLTYTSAAMRP